MTQKYKDYSKIMEGKMSTMYTFWFKATFVDQLTVHIGDKTVLHLLVISWEMHYLHQQKNSFGKMHLDW